MIKVNYDSEVNILELFFNKKKVADSEMHGCVIDYDKEGNIVYIEILDVNPQAIKSLVKKVKKE
ncbi:DUF2283 domain-containing protein [Candidatus Peregrinibacteria bacterium]|nr:DUF2283 domain-containing protein [Candidatus Peregrinibacteria bacterium]